MRQGIVRAHRRPGRSGSPIARALRALPGWLVGTTLAFCACLTAQTTHAQVPWPTKPVRIVIPFSPGANAEIIARAIAQRLGPALGQQIILDNRPGGAANIGAEIVARAPADGYTLFLAGPPAAINMSLFRKLGYDTLTDFVPIILCTRVPNVLTLHPSVPAKSVRELVALARARPGQLNFASGGLGSANHMAGELLKLAAKIDIVHVPYKGSAPAITDAVGGHVEMLFVGISSVAALVSGGRLRAVATGSAKRLPMIPEVPTFIEAGYPDVTTSVWFGLLAPAATPPAIVTRLNGEIDRILTSAEVRDRLIADGQEPGGGTAAEFGRFVKSEVDRYARVVKAAGLRAE